MILLITMKIIKENINDKINVGSDNNKINEESDDNENNKENNENNIDINLERNCNFIRLIVILLL
jgi:hypothetical protein